MRHLLIPAILVLVFAVFLSPADAQRNASEDQERALQERLDRGQAEQLALLRKTLDGVLSVYLEGNTTTPFVTDATFVERLRFTDKDYLVFRTKDGERVVIRTQHIVAIRIKEAK